jgi:cobalt/nickel transport system permease protein
MDQYAYANKVNKVHPVEKVLFSMITLFLAVASKTYAIHSIIFVGMTLATLFIAGIPKRIYFNLLLLPVFFIILGIIPVLMEVSHTYTGFLFDIKLLNTYLGITKQGLASTLTIILRSMAAVSCLYFMALTTPVNDIFELLKKIRVPHILIEIMYLLYRFIFVLIDASMTIYYAQSARLGYSSIGASFKSLGKLASMVFIKAYNNSQALYVSLISRGYTGELCVISFKYKLDLRNIIFIIIVEALLLLLSWILGGS